MRHTVRTASLVVVVVLVALWSIFPPREKLRLGKDLAGGVSLVYSVLITPGDNASEVMSRLVEVLKKRVDPDAQMDISFVPQGRDRLEITMPLPNDDVKRLRADVERQIDALGTSSLDADRLDRLLRSDPAEREAEIARVAGGNPTREAQLRAAGAAFDAYRAAAEALKQAQEAGTAEAELMPLIERTANAEIALDQTRQAVIAGSISPDDLRRILELSNQSTTKRDETSATKEQVVLPSPRAKALERLRAQHPDSAAAIDQAVAAWDAYRAQRRTLDDPEDLIRLLRGAGVLDFRITVRPGAHPEESRLRQELRERGPKNVKATDVGWFKINQIENWLNTKQDGERLLSDPAGFFSRQGYVAAEFDGEYYMLAYDSPGSRLTKAEGDWKVTRAGRTTDNLGRGAISYEMDARGAMLQGQLTGDHVGENMAVLLDDQVYTAPVLNSRIDKSGMISGGSDGFKDAEIDYIVRTLAAGSLQAKLSPDPISRDAIGPEFGADNLARGLESGVISFLVCAAFLMGYYFFCGLIASVALVVNCILLIGVMAINHWAFTLPGIAGVILTFAMAVDANVLIYERMREEFGRGADAKTAVRLGYDRALSAIVDGNVTNLIHCMVLVFLGTQEIKGFGLAMAVGVVTTLFAQLVVTRLIFDILVDRFGVNRFRMLPMVVPAVQRAFDLSVDWMRLRTPMTLLFAGLIALSAFFIWSRGAEMLDNEFRGGTAIRVQLRAADGGGLETLTRQEVDDRLRAYVQSSGDPEIAPLAGADVIVINPEPDGVTSSTFEFKTLLTDSRKIQAAVIASLSDVIDAQPALRFRGADAAGPETPAFPVIDRVLGDNIERPLIRSRVDEFMGGLAILVEGIEPPVSASSLRARLEQTAGQAAFAGATARTRTVVVLEGTEESARSIAILVRDPTISFFNDQADWARGLRDPEWALTRTALLESTTLSSVRSFSPAIAESFTAQAIAAGTLSVVLIVIYVGVRFNSLRFSIAAITPTIMDCFIAVGLIAVAQVIVEKYPGVGHALGIEAYKIDLTIVAAILTILGYSINDKIVVLDRIRENRGKLKYVKRETINRSLNQTISRTIMTGMTTIISTFVLFLLGSSEVRGFAFVLGLGIICGTASSIAIGAPMVWSRKAEQEHERDGGPGAPVPTLP
jgi:SecD/SecF fusion protein